MAHREQLRFVQGARDLLFKDLAEKDIFEVGSYDVNGTIRKIFAGCRTYVGADLSVGPGVDVVGSGHEIDKPDESFDLTLSCECFEHNPFWLETFKNMHRMTKADGYMVITCASRGRIEHGTSRTTMADSPGTSAVGIDYYRNLVEDDFRKKLPLDDMFADYCFWYIEASSDLYFIGRKSGAVSGNNISSLFSGLIREVRSISAVHRGFLRQLFFRAYRLPLDVVARATSDERFQNFAVPYDRMFSPFKAAPK
jgi:SAM-dependent methyltransferase